MAEHSEELDEDIPPLEDMSEVIERAMRTQKVAQSVQRSAEKAPVTSSKVTQAPQAGDIPVAADLGQPVVAKTPKENATSSKDSSSSSTFAGFKKGFLFSEPSMKGPSNHSSRKTKTRPEPVSSVSTPSDEKKRVAAKKDSKGSAKDDGIPLVKPQSEGASNTSGLEFPEVQAAMKESYPLLNTKDWVTDDLLSKIEKHPTLSKVFQDPHLSQVVAQFQQNPQAALEAAKGNSETQKFLQEFCALMGDHFNQLADKDEASKAATSAPLIAEVSSPSSSTSSPPSAPSPGEEAQMRETLARPDVQRVLQDPEIQRLIVALKTNPENAQRLLKSGNDDFRQKVKVLIDNGLLAMQHF